MPLNKLRSSPASAASRRRDGSRRAGDQKHDLCRVEPLVVFQPAGRIAANLDAAAPTRARMMRLPSVSWRQAEVGQKMIVEKVSERTMPHVVQQAGHAQQRLDVAAAGHVGANLAQAVVQRGRRATRQMHHPQDMLEPRVLGRRKDPPGGLQAGGFAAAAAPRDGR